MALVSVDIIVKCFMTVLYLIDQIRAGRTVLFDLDNTIYNEDIFLLGAYKLLALNQNRYRPDLVYIYLSETLHDQGTSRIFDKLLHHFPDIDLNINDCLFFLRNYRAKPLIRPYRWYVDLINSLDDSFHVRIITNGNVLQQINKISSIDLCLPENRYSVVYANSIAGKPSPASFYEFHDSDNFTNPIYIGDSDVDRTFCENLSIEFFNVNSVID